MDKKQDNLTSIKEIIEEARAGRMFIIVDDEDRENEGDLVIPAQMTTPAAINFMAKHGRGLICLALKRQRVESLGLDLMTRNNHSRHQTAFTISIEAKHGVTTGISASDRSHTISVAINSNKDQGDLVSPGHVFPLMARDGGVLVRAGHTEAAVDIAQLAGLNPSGVICEVMNDDGTMAHLKDLRKFAKKHGLKIASIADLIAYRRRNEKLVDKIVEKKTKIGNYGDFRMCIYKNRIEQIEHIALIKENTDFSKPVLTRMHNFDILRDMLDIKLAGRDNKMLHRGLALVSKRDSGVVVILRESKNSSVSDYLQEEAGETYIGTGNLRNYGIGAQILLDIGVRDMILITGKRPSVVGIEGYGLNITGYES